MGRGGGGGGSGGGGGGGRGGAGIAANASGGRVRQIAGSNYNTADVVNQAIRDARPNPDLARRELERLGHRNPAESVVRDYAVQHAVLSNIGRITGSNAMDQVGKWNFTNADTIHSSFNSYLNRRRQGQQQRWTARTKRP